MKSTTAGTNAKQKWTAFELLMLAPFGLMIWYVGTQPLVLPVVAPSNPTVANVVAIPAEPTFAPSVTLKADPDAPVFVSTGTTILQRIAPVARVVLDAQEAVPGVEAAAQPPAPSEPAVAVSTTAVTENSAIETKASASMHIEITDGTGVEGLAKDISSHLEKSGVTVSKTTSLAAGVQRRTVILYRDGFEADAERLSKLFARPPALVNNTRSRNASDASDVRLVLGTAAVREKGLQTARLAASAM